MNHVIELIHLDLHMGSSSHSSRDFTASIDGVELKGKVTFNVHKTKFKNNTCWTYSFSFDDKRITKHKDWKEIRRQLLLKMVESNGAMCTPKEIIR